MTESISTVQARDHLSGHCPEPVEAVLLVHPPGHRKKVFRRKLLSSRLHILNYLVLTPTHVRLFGLGGRTGMQVKEQLGAWPRGEVQVRMETTERSSFFASTGQTLEWRVFCLHLSGPDLELAVDVRADGGLFIGDEDFLDQPDPGPEVQEAIDGLREEAAAIHDSVDAFVRALAPA